MIFPSLSDFDSIFPCGSRGNVKITVQYSSQDESKWLNISFSTISWIDFILAC